VWNALNVCCCCCCCWWWWWWWWSSHEVTVQVACIIISQSINNCIVLSSLEAPQLQLQQPSPSAVLALPTPAGHLPVVAAVLLLKFVARLWWVGLRDHTAVCWHHHHHHHWPCTVLQSPYTSPWYLLPALPHWLTPVYLHIYLCLCALSTHWHTDELPCAPCRQPCGHNDFINIVLHSVCVCVCKLSMMHTTAVFIVLMSVVLRCLMQPFSTHKTSRWTI